MVARGAPYSLQVEFDVDRYSSATSQKIDTQSPIRIDAHMREKKRIEYPTNCLVL